VWPQLLVRSYNVFAGRSDAPNGFLAIWLGAQCWMAFQLQRAQEAERQAGATNIAIAYRAATRLAIELDMVGDCERFSGWLLTSHLPVYACSSGKYLDMPELFVI